MDGFVIVGSLLALIFIVVTVIRARSKKNPGGKT